MARPGRDPLPIPFSKDGFSGLFNTLLHGGRPLPNLIGPRGFPLGRKANPGAFSQGTCPFWVRDFLLGYGQFGGPFIPKVLSLHSFNFPGDLNILWGFPHFKSAISRIPFPGGKIGPLGGYITLESFPLGVARLTRLNSFPSGPFPQLGFGLGILPFPFNKPRGSFWPGSNLDFHSSTLFWARRFFTNARGFKTLHPHNLGCFPNFRADEFTGGQKAFSTNFRAHIFHMTLLNPNS